MTPNRLICTQYASSERRRERKGSTDYEKRNRQQLKNLERQVQDKILADSRPKPKPFRLKEFENVPARVVSKAGNRVSDGRTGRQVDRALKAGQNKGHEREETRETECKLRNGHRVGAPNVDFVGLNADRAKETPRKVCLVTLALHCSYKPNVRRLTDL